MSKKSPQQLISFDRADMFDLVGICIDVVKVGEQEIVTN